MRGFLRTERRARLRAQPHEQPVADLLQERGLAVLVGLLEDSGRAIHSRLSTLPPALVESDPPPGAHFTLRGSGIPCRKIGLPQYERRIHATGNARRKIEYEHTTVVILIYEQPIVCFIYCHPKRLGHPALCRSCGRRIE